MTIRGRSTHLVLAFSLGAGLCAPGLVHAQGLGARIQQAPIKAKRSIGRYVRVGALAVSLAVPGMMGVHSYNGLVREQQQVAASFSGVDVQLQRRADLIPNLVSVVKGYAKFEGETLTNIAKARSAMLSATTVDGKIAASQQLSTAMMPILAVQERYPELKANEQFQSLMRSLEDTENRIMIERSRYNDAAAAYNISLKTFPRGVVAKMGSFKEAPYFQADSGAKGPVTVDFNK